MPPSPRSLADQAARLRDAARAAGCRAAGWWAPDALLEAGRLGSVGPFSGFCSAARELADALVELQQRRAEVADLRNMLTPALMLGGELAGYFEVMPPEALEHLSPAERLLATLPARWRQHQEQHGSTIEGSKGQRTQAREDVQGEATEQGGQETPAEAEEEAGW